MYNVSYELARALQQDHLREAKQGRTNRLWDVRRKAMKKVRNTGRK